MAPEIGLNGLMLDYPHSGSAIYARNLAASLPSAAPDLRFRLFLRGADFESLASSGGPREAERRGGEDIHLQGSRDGPLSTARDATSSMVRVERLRSPLGRINRGRGVGARLDKLGWEIAMLPLASAARGESLLHFLYFAAPLAAACPVVVTIHDLIPLVLPGYHRSRQSALYSRFMARMARRANAIITVSEHSRQDIVRTLGVREDRVHVTYEAVDERFHPGADEARSDEVRRAYGLPARFVLSIGGAERRKNLELLVRAWARAAGRMRELEIRLAIVADFPPPDRLYPDVPGLIRARNLCDDVVVVPRVEERDKPDLYRAALGLCYPSVYEGFGFPPLEAMACGIPVLASDASSLPEVVGDGGWLLPPDDESVWAEALVRLAESEEDRRDLRRRGLARAAGFSWGRTAEQTASIYRSVLSRCGS
ncbi:MAG: glycosyltransferase family 4 protein [Chloroflexi bacterium]|nr:glycosyltransferase family 4 protein [Chloroflexota bacterium]